MSISPSTRERIVAVIIAARTGLGLCVCYWLGQMACDVWLFHLGSFSERFIPPVPYQLGCRLFVAAFLLLYALLARRPAARGQEIVMDGKTLSEVTFLSRAAMEFVELPVETDIYEFIGHKLQALTPESLILVNSFDEESDALRVRVVLGAGKLLASVVRLLGQHPVGLTFPLPDVARRGITKGVLEKADGGLFQACFGTINQDLCHKIEYLIRMDEVYGVGFARKGGIFGDALIVTRKGHPLANHGVIEAFVNQASVALQRRKAEETLHSLSLVDELTGLYNRRGFLTLAEQQLKIANRTRRNMLLLFADLDRLKWINDTFGHGEGDVAIRETGRIFQRCFRESDIVARLGGDEFVALAVEIGEAPQHLFSQRLQENLAEFNASSVGYTLSMSTGIVRYEPNSDMTIHELLDHADAMMYEQKRRRHAGRGQEVGARS